MKTNDLKKGDIVRLSNGWMAVIADNARGNTRIATVYGDYTETGSVYSHDIVSKLVRVDPEAVPSGVRIRIVATKTGPLDVGLYQEHLIEHTPQQLKLRQAVESL